MRMYAGVRNHMLATIRPVRPANLAMAVLQLLLLLFCVVVGI